MLRALPTFFVPELFDILYSMGHSDCLLIADANFPAASRARRLLRLEVEADVLLDAILPYFPLDGFVAQPVRLMRPLPHEERPEIWARYGEILRARDRDGAFKDFAFLERLDFYTYAAEAYAIIQTKTTARYANVALHKGVC